MNRPRAIVRALLTVLATLGALPLGSHAAPASGWTVAIPPYHTLGGTIVADLSAPMSQWVRQGDFPTEAACKAEIGDEATRSEVANRMVDTVGAGLTDALRGQVVEAIRHARCVPRAD